MLALATLIAASEISLSSFTLPLIGAEFGVSPGTTAWVLLAYTLPSAALALPAGRWVDGADLRIVYLAGLVGIGVFSVLGVLAPAVSAAAWSVGGFRGGVSVLSGVACAAFALAVLGTATGRRTRSSD